MTELNGSLYVPADDGSTGAELWKTNGTTAGTVLVKNINPGSASSAPSDIVAVGSRLFFVADDGSHGPELWQSNGTGPGTTLVKDIATGAPGSAGSNLTGLGAQLYLSADDGSHGQELWTSDGTAPGTQLVADLNASGSSSPHELIDLNGTLLFAADDGIAGDELRKLSPFVAGCSKTGATVSIGIPTGGAVTIGRSGSNFNITGGGIVDPTCGGATVNNVDTVEVAGAGGNESLTIDESGGPFAPGLTPEAAPAEIEFAVDLGAGSDSLTVQGGPAGREDHARDDRRQPQRRLGCRPHCVGRRELDGERR